MNPVVKKCCLVAVVILSQATQVLAGDQNDSQLEEVIYGHKDGLAMTFDVLQPVTEPNGAAVVFIVSGGWKSEWAPPGQTRAFLSPFLSAGYTGFAVRHGSSPRYSIAEALDDVRQAIRFIRRDASKFEIDANRIGVVGMSAGGHLTLMLATTGRDADPTAANPLDRISCRIAAGVALVPPSDLTNYVWSTPGLDPQYLKFPGLDITKEQAQQLSPRYFVTKDDAPCLIISGGKDTLVLPEQGRWIHEEMDRTGVSNRFILYENSGHNLQQDRLQAIVETVNWFDENLKPQPSTSAE